MIKKIISLGIFTLSLAACSVESKPQTIEGKVSLAPNLANKIGPSDVLYILAYPETQASLTSPLAVHKIAPVILPTKYTLSQEDIIFPEKKLEGSLNIMARLQKNPESNPSQKGDFEGSAKKNPVKRGSKNVDIILLSP